jgi:hypothetical protein
VGEQEYHCSGHVFLEANCKSSGWDFDGSNLIGECVYDSDGTCGGKVGDIILPDNPLCGGCAGNADRFDSMAGTGLTRVLNIVGHLGFDEGGPPGDDDRHHRASGWHREHPNEPAPSGMGRGFWINLLSNFGY